MIRCTIELIPGGLEDHPRRQVLGVVEIANVGGSNTTGQYRVVLMRKLGRARVRAQAWRDALLGKRDTEALQDMLVGDVVGFPRLRLGPYDLMYRALVACGVDKRNRS